jgi:hypothetical protein
MRPILLLKRFALTAALMGFAACQTISAAPDIQILGVTNTLWRFTNCAAIGSPSAAIPTISSPGYNDSTWAQGRGLFGFETTPAEYFYPGTPSVLIPFNTPIPPPGQSGPVVVYFRTTFNWSSGDPTYVVLHSTNYLDDGVVYYLNGTEVARRRVPAGDDCTTLGQNPAAEGDPVANGDIVDFPTGALVSGNNVLIAELRQSGTGSSDDVFGMSLTAVLPFAPTNQVVTSPTNQQLVQFRSTTLRCFAGGSPAPTFQWYEDGAEIFGATTSSLALSNGSPDTVTHTYFCRVTNPLGSFDTRVATVVYTTDTVNPTVLSVSQAGAFDRVSIQYSEAMTPTLEGGTLDPFDYEVFDALDNPLGVGGVSINPDGAGVTLTLGSPMVENAVYRVQIGGTGGDILDLAGNILTPTNVTIRSWVSSECAGVIFEAYDTVIPNVAAQTAIIALTSNPNFPNNPRETFLLNSFTSVAAPGYGDGQGAGSHNDYGVRMRAVFIPPSSGNWVFYLSSDDAGQIFLNPNGPGAGGKIMIQNETGCCNPYATHASAPQALVAGRGYYLEMLYKEGIGGDYGFAFAAPQGVAPPSAGATALTINDAIPGSMLGSPAAPAGVAGNFTITQPPANQFAVPNTVVTFTVGTSTDVPQCYQWYRNDGLGAVEIPGAVGARYSLTATLGDNGAKFSVKVSMIGVPSQTSAEGTLTVGADTNRPTVLSVAANAAGTSLTVTYSEPMGPSAAIAANYTINGVAASSATLNGSATVATVVPASPLQGAGCTLHQVRISGVRDQASVSNLLNPDPTTVSLSVPTVEILPLNATWKYNDTGTDLGTSWRDVGFIDAAWPSGPAPLGFEPGTPQVPVVATPISDVTTNKTAYFRTHFNLAVAPSSVLLLQLNEIVDDGAVYYLNGVEAHRSYMPAAPAVIDASTLATGGGPEPVNGTHTVVAVTIAKTGLVAGDNVLAVELHPSSLTSSDSEFAAQLSIVQCLPTLVIQHVGSQVRLTWTDAAYRLETAPTPNGPWTAQAGASGLMLTSSAGNAFFRLVTP